MPLQNTIFHSLWTIVNRLAAVKAPILKCLHILLEVTLQLLVSPNMGALSMSVPLLWEKLYVTWLANAIAPQVKANLKFILFHFEIILAEKIVHALMDCIEQHWQEDDFVILKVDLNKHLFMVSRHGLDRLCPCSTFCNCFSLWASSHHTFLWHPLGCPTMELGVQHNDPLSPLLFSLVINILVSAISIREDCAGLT